LIEASNHSTDADENDFIHFKSLANIGVNILSYLASAAYKCQDEFKEICQDANADSNLSFPYIKVPRKIITASERISREEKIAKNKNKEISGGNRIISSSSASSSLLSSLSRDIALKTNNRLRQSFASEFEKKGKEETRRKSILNLLTSSSSSS
jgi:hypothetical protein